MLNPSLSLSLSSSLTRRRLIVIAATAAGSAYLTGVRTAAAGDAVRWHGSALGAQVSIEIHHPDRAEAVPFGDREAAAAFAAANGGRVVTFTQIPSAYVLGSDAPGDQSEHDRPNVRLN